MTSSLIGALAGLALGVVDFIVLRVAGRRLQGPLGGQMLTLLALTQLIAFPLIGWFVGPVLFGE